MVEFDKSQKHSDNYFVSKGDTTVYVHQSEIRDLKHCLEKATDKNTGFHSWQTSHSKPSTVEASSDGIRLDNGVGRGVDLTYTEAREVVRQIDARMVKEAIVDRQLDRK